MKYSILEKLIKAGFECSETKELYTGNICKNIDESEISTGGYCNLCTDRDCEIEIIYSPNPSLRELIEACVKLSDTGDFHLERNDTGIWGSSVDCFKGVKYIDGDTPEEAVANLWLDLTKRTRKH